MKTLMAVILGAFIGGGSAYMLWEFSGDPRGIVMQNDDPFGSTDEYPFGSATGEDPFGHDDDPFATSTDENPFGNATVDNAFGIDDDPFVNFNTIFGSPTDDDPFGTTKS